jgi:hypothetical protein
MDEGEMREERELPNNGNETRFGHCNIICQNGNVFIEEIFAKARGRRQESAAPKNPGDDLALDTKRAHVCQQRSASETLRHFQP